MACQLTADELQVYFKLIWDGPIININHYNWFETISDSAIKNHAYRYTALEKQFRIRIYRGRKVRLKANPKRR